jgi:hypothetical protein
MTMMTHSLRRFALTAHVASSVGLLVLLVPTVLSVYKPWGLTPYGRRKQHELRAPSQQPQAPSQRPSLDSSSDIGVLLNGQSISITLRRAHVSGFVVIAVAVHVVIPHLL